MCPKKCPNFGHIVDIFWILLPCLDIFCAPNYKCPKCDQPELNVSIKCPKIGHIMDISLQFGCFLDIISKVGHVLGIIRAHFVFWLHFWTYYGHFWGLCVQNVSIPTSCSSARRRILLPLYYYYDQNLWQEIRRSSSVHSLTICI